MSAQYQATQTLAESATLREAAPKLLQIACENFNWDMGQLWLVDANTHALHLFSAWHLPHISLSNIKATTQLSSSHSTAHVVSNIWQNKQSIWMCSSQFDIQSNIQSKSTPISSQIADEKNWMSVCGCPIIYQNSVLGIMIFFCQRVWQSDLDVLEAIEAIANQTGQFIKRQQTEEALCQLTAVVASSSDAIIHTTLNKIVTRWNVGAEKMYGYSADEAKGQNFEHLVKANHVNVDQYGFNTQPTHINHQQHIHQCCDGTLINVFLNVFSITGVAEQQTEMVWVVRNGSDHCNLEMMKDEFVSIVNHEFRTPLTSIYGALGLLLAGKLGEMPKQSKPFLDIAIANTNRLMRLVDDIFDLEQIASGTVISTNQSCNIAALLAQIAEEMQSTAAQASITLNVSSSFVYSDSICCNIDGDRIRQMLTILLKNAIKFSSPHTTISLHAEVVDDSDITNAKRLASHSELLEKNCLAAKSQSCSSILVLSVTDQGQGIPADQLETIFERFYQIDASDARQKGGTGLGLAICRSIVQQHQGKIWVESTLGKGSTFFIALPMHNPATVQAL